MWGLLLPSLEVFREGFSRFIIEQLPSTPLDNYTSHLSLSALDTMAGGETNSPKASTLDISDVKNISDSDSAHPEKLVQGVTDDQYPHGLKLVLLAGSSIVAVFLIALDQVSTLPTHAGTEIMPLTRKVSRPSSAQQFPRSRTSSMASKTCLGMPRPTS